MSIPLTLSEQSAGVAGEAGVGSAPAAAGAVVRGVFRVLRSAAALLLSVVALSVTGSAGPAMAQFRATGPAEPVEFPFSLTCGILQQVPSERDDDPVHVILVTPGFKNVDGKQVLTDLGVLHITAFGRKFPRSDQYSNDYLAQVPGKLDITWRGTWRKNGAVRMTGRVWHSADRGRWFYSEEQTRDGRPQMRTLAGCHPTEQE